MIEPIKYEPPTLGYLADTACSYFYAGLYRIQSGRWGVTSAYEEFYYGLAVMGLYSLEYNAVSHKWPISISDDDREKVELSMVLCSQLQKELEKVSEMIESQEKSKRFRSKFFLY